MEKYETFKQRNINFSNKGYFFEKGMMEDVMKRNYGIACEVEKTYNETFGNIDGPRIGDIVEFSDGFRIYNHAKVVENLYGGSKYGMLCVCENGSSHTDGKYFSTSGGAFKAIHKSKFQYVGESENIVWTWGCYGAGANQGIYFPLKVRKWIIPYEPIQQVSRVVIKGQNGKDWHGRPTDAVWIENFADCYGYHAQSFRSIRAYRAWASYVGFKSKPRKGTFDRESSQAIIRKYFWEKSEVPKGAKPLKLFSNGHLADSFVVNDGKNIVYYIPNPNILPESPRFGTKEYEEERKEIIKYRDNPLGV